MLTDRQKQMIEAYLPSPRDKSLMRMCEYYAQDVNGKVHKVFVSEINPSIKEDTTLYGVRYDSTGKRFDAGFGYGCTHKYELYDNAEDCRNRTHPWYDWWENLRELQEENEYEKISFIRDRISDAELCVMVAEEAAEVAQAALKLHRVLDGTNPTPTNKASAVSKLGQEVDDLMVALTALRYTDEPKDTMSLYQHNKLDRWIARLKEASNDN